MSSHTVKIIALGFVAGALGVMIFHQPMAWFVTGRLPWSNWSPIPPFGVPAILNATFWGGVWGIVLALVVQRVPRGLLFIVAAALFGALMPTLVGWYVIPLIKGGAIGPRGVWYNGPLINGAWGLGAGVFLTMLRSPSR